MKILITGGGGLIGQSIAKKHLAEGDEVFIYDNKSNIFNDYSKITGIDCSGKSLKKIFKEHKFDVVSHQAAMVGVGNSQRDIVNYTKNNISLTAELLEIILYAKNKPSCLILASSMGPYGEGPLLCSRHGVVYLKNQRTSIETTCPQCEAIVTPTLINENTERYPQSIYAITKQTQEEMFKVFANTYNIKTIALRYFSVYGTECNPNNPYTGVLSIIANKIINSNRVELFEDGEQTRDLIHSDDCAAAHFTASRYKTNNNFEAFNIATGKSVTLKYVANKMISILSPKIPLVFDKKLRKGDIKYSYAATEKATKNLNWTSKIKLDKSIDEYCNFIKNNWDKFKKPDSCEEEKNKLNKLNLLK
jgi:dTDP-L-rhamnose 4-epimerase